MSCKSTMKLLLVHKAWDLLSNKDTITDYQCRLFYRVKSFRCTAWGLPRRYAFGLVRVACRKGVYQIWCDFDRASSLICGNKMPTGCNRGLYCRSYCLLNMFRAPLCPSSGAQEYYTVVAARGISCCGFQVAGLVWSWGLCVRFAGCWFHISTFSKQTPHFTNM